MKKIISVLLVLAMVCVLTGCVSAREYDELTQKYESLSEKYNSLVTDHNTLQGEYDNLSDMYDETAANYKDLYSQYVAAVEDDMSAPIVITVIAEKIDETAVVTVFDEKIVHIMVRKATDIKEKVEENYSMIPFALGSEGYKSCIISVVDESGKCVYGWTIYETGDYTSFLSN